jgi:hypothetical protein
LLFTERLGHHPFPPTSETFIRIFKPAVSPHFHSGANTTLSTNKSGDGNPFAEKNNARTPGHSAAEREMISWRLGDFAPLR